MRYRLANHQEVAHFWANEIQEEGSGHNMFFTDKTIYSYGGHFPIAKHYDNDLILFTNKGYSSSTSKHISYTRQAIPCGRKIIYCHNPETPQDMDNLKCAIADIEYNLKKAIKARSRKLEYMRDAEYAYNQLIELKTIFKIKGWKIPKYDFSIPENVMEVIREKERKATAKRKRQKAKQRKQDKVDIVEFLKDVKDWKAGEIKSAYDVRHRRFINETDYCRINGDSVESMRSANAPLKEVKVALKLIKKGKPIKGIKLGHYTVISYDKECLKIGCHDFAQTEIDYLMAQLNLN